MTDETGILEDASMDASIDHDGEYGLKGNLLVSGWDDETNTFVTRLATEAEIVPALLQIVAKLDAKLRRLAE